MTIPVHTRKTLLNRKPSPVSCVYFLLFYYCASHAEIIRGRKVCQHPRQAETCGVNYMHDVLRMHVSFGENRAAASTERCTL